MKTLLIITIVLVFVVSFFVYATYQDDKKEKSYIGRKVIIDRDTLTIVGIKGVFVPDYRLSNGTIVSKQFIFQQDKKGKVQ